MFEHDMAEGFPLLTTKYVPFTLVAQELEFFIKGITDKNWLRDRNNHIWDEWCSPAKVAYGHDDETRKKMMEERELGPIYGWQWSHFGRAYQPIPIIETNFQTVHPEGDDHRIGEEGKNEAGQEYTIVKLLGKDAQGRKIYAVQFKRSKYVNNKVRSDLLATGKFGDPYSPSVKNAACLGAKEAIEKSCDYSGIEYNSDLYKNLKKIWDHMIDRCYNPDCKEHKYYGIRGTHVERRWLVFANFLKDVSEIEGWSFKKKDLSYQLDKDLNGGLLYSKKNCIWMSKEENLGHTRRIRYFEAISPGGEVFKQKNQTLFAENHGLDRSKISACLRGVREKHKGWTFHYLEEKENINYGVNQLQKVIDTLKTNPNDRRMIVSAWNPMDIGQMALPPCHYGFQVTVINGRLNLLWNQRSVDTALGLPFNIASYGLLLTLLALESGFEPGTLVGFLGDTHIYENHVQGLTQQLERAPFALPGIENTSFNSIFDWQYKDTVLTDYQHHPAIRFEIAV
jgi:thymidylate synthase